MMDEIYMYLCVRAESLERAETLREACSILLHTFFFPLLSVL